MATFYSNRPIVTDGLHMCLDAGNPKSSGSSQWLDLSGNTYDAKFTGSISFITDYQGGYRSNDSQDTDIIGMPIAALSNLTSGNNWTLETWCTHTGTNQEYMHSMATAANQNLSIQEWNDGIRHWSSILPTYTGSVPTPNNNTPFQYTIVRDTSINAAMSYYLNGEFKGSLGINQDGANANITTTEGWVLNQEQDSVWGGYDLTQCWAGDFFIVRLYDRSLSADEVKQNFEALRGRFGI